MVRLGALQLISESINKINFNSSMVRLGEFAAMLIVRIVLISIPVWCDWEFSWFTRREISNSFQFQYGAIGSRGHCRIVRACNDFNSSMVRLGGNRPYSGFGRLATFQFQYGAIGSLYWLRLGMITIKYFNSSMVRLGVCNYRNILHLLRISIPVWCDWENLLLKKKLKKLYFNSSMVRLGAE